MRIAFINLYHSGFYHRSGKPGQFNVHPGDLYPTEAAALADIDPTAPYVGTAQVIVPVGVPLGEVNPDNSVPTPLSETRAIYDVMGVEALRDYNTGGFI